MNEDFEWFEEHYEEFQRVYGDSYLAIKDKRVLGVYDSCANGVRETMKTEPLGTFIVQEIKVDRLAYIACIN